jgi:hypothetical protein
MRLRQLKLAMDQTCMFEQIVGDRFAYIIDLQMDTYFLFFSSKSMSVYLIVTLKSVKKGYINLKFKNSLPIFSNF